MLDPTEEQAYREALFSLLENSKVSRSALYLMEPTGEFRLAAHLGFSPRDLPVASFGKENPLFQRVNHFRKPFYFNSPKDAGKTVSSWKPPTRRGCSRRRFTRTAG